MRPKLFAGIMKVFAFLLRRMLVSDCMFIAILLYSFSESGWYRQPPIPFLFKVYSNHIAKDILSGSMQCMSILSQLQLYFLHTQCFGHLCHCQSTHREAMNALADLFYSAFHCYQILSKAQLRGCHNLSIIRSCLGVTIDSADGKRALNHHVTGSKCDTHSFAQLASSSSS